MALERTNLDVKPLIRTKRGQERLMALYEYTQEHPDRALSEIAEHFGYDTDRADQLLQQARIYLRREGMYRVEEDRFRLRQLSARKLDEEEVAAEVAAGGKKRFSNRTMVWGLERIIELMMKYLNDPTMIATARPGELALAVCQLIDKRQLLLGLPTEIRREETRRVTEMLPVLLGEMQRRGMIDAGAVPLELTERDGVYESSASPND